MGSRAVTDKFNLGCFCINFIILFTIETKASSSNYCKNYFLILAHLHYQIYYYFLIISKYILAIYSHQIIMGKFA